MEYAIVSIVALLVLFVTNYDFVFRRKVAGKIPAHKEYLFFILSVSIFYICDMLWGIFDQYKIYPGNHIVTVLFFVVMSISVFLWSLYVVAYLGHKRFFSRLAKIVGLVLMVGGIVLIIVNFFHPIMFEYVDGVYKIMIGRSIYFIVQAAMFSITSIYAFVNSYLNRHKKEISSKHIAIGIFGLEMAVAIGFQIPFELEPIYSFGYLFGLLVLNTFVVAEQKKEYQLALAEGLDREKKTEEELDYAKKLAYKDSLTGVKSKHAYVEMEIRIDKDISEKKDLAFAVAVFDLNDLKFVNDRLGHDSGDQYIIDSCHLISQFFPHSDIYRFGGDEFILFIDGEDYQDRRALLNAFNKEIDRSFETGNPIIATGISDYRPGKDNTFRDVFERADERMYVRKKQLKETGRIDIYKFLQKDKLTESYEELIKEELLKTRDESFKNVNPRLAFFKIFYQNEEYSLIDLLNNSSCDEVMEVNLLDDTFKIFYHVDGKYFVPATDLTFSKFFEFGYEHLVYPDDRQVFHDFMNPKGFLERLKNNEIPNFGVEHFRYKLQDGDYRYVEQCVIAGQENGIPEGSFRLYVFDIHNYKARQNGFVSNDKSIVSKGRDSVTNLPLEREFLLRGQDVMIGKPDCEWCLISIDIKHFRFFDEWYGRESGDMMLAKFGAALAESEIELNGLSGYFGKDDFCVLMPYDKDKINNLYEKLRGTIHSFGYTAGFTPIFGVAMVEKGLSLIDAFDRATIAAARAREDISTPIRVYDSEMQFLSQNESRLLSEFMQALKNDEITFYLQPQCRISSKKVVGVEALARWIKKDGTIVSPGVFIPVLEKYGFIPDLDRHIWEKACQALRSWLDRGHVVVPISLNVARSDLFAFDVAQFFIDIAEKYHIDHNLLKIEITESSYVEASEQVEKLVKKLHENGFMVLMDDFGSGYSSLNMLSNLEIDAIKMDMNFLHFEGKDYDKAIHVLESVVNMAKVIALPIIVEGVEKKEHADFLESLGCRYLQGYYFYKPMPKDDFEKLISDESFIDNRGFIAKRNEQVRIREFLDKNIFSDSMLNNIIGPVAFYSWNGKTTDIVRFNEQFYQAVHVREFAERLDNIERFLHKSDIDKMYNAFKKAMEEKLTGASDILRFYAPDGTILSFRIHFYYIGKKEGGERFYGAAQNVTILTDLQEEMRLIANYSRDGMVFVRKINNRFVYTVASRSISDLFDISPEELEKELNSDDFSRKRVVNRRKLDVFRKSFAEFAAEKKNFEANLEVYDSNRQPVNLHIVFTCVSDLSNNIEYILRTTYSL